jgi:transposase
MGKRFHSCSLEQPYLLPPSLQDWLPQDHLARFIADVASQLDLSQIYAAYERKDGRGLAAYHPLLMTRLLLYGYAIGVRSSRRIEKASYDDLAFRYLSADQHPDHDTIAAFRQQHLKCAGQSVCASVTYVPACRIGEAGTAGHRWHQGAGERERAAVHAAPGFV